MSSLRSAFTRVVLAAAFVGSLAACAMATDPNEPQVSGVYKESQVSTTATVQKIELDKRLVTLKREDGKVVTIKAGDQVKNLAQVKVGDLVHTTYYESIAYEVYKPESDAEVGVKSASGVGAAKPGEKPAGVVADVVQVTATIVAIDKATPSVTLKRPDGEVVAIKVRDVTKLDKVAVGDLVEITYTEALAIVVEPATAN